MAGPAYGWFSFTPTVSQALHSSRGRPSSNFSSSKQRMPNKRYDLNGQMWFRLMQRLMYCLSNRYHKGNAEESYCSSPWHTASKFTQKQLNPGWNPHRHAHPGVPNGTQTSDCCTLQRSIGCCSPNITWCDQLASHNPSKRVAS